MKFLTVMFTALLPLLAGCSDMNVADFKNTKPAFVLEDYFLGETQAWGLFQDRFGKVRRQFTVDISGAIENGELVLDEHFTYRDGEKDRRVWRIRRIDNTLYEGRADDVIGVAKGRSSGNALHWQYDVNLKVGESTWRVHFNDWMFLQPGNVLMNKAKVTKFGFEIGEVTLTFFKPDLTNPDLAKRGLSKTDFNKRGVSKPAIKAPETAPETVKAQL